MLHGSKSPVPTSKLVSSLQPKVGPSKASQVFFRPPTPAPTSDTNNDMDNIDIEDADPMVTIPAPAPSHDQDHSAVMAGIDGDTFMDEFVDMKAFYASDAKEKVLADLQAATASTHNLVETLSLWSTNSYCLNADASDMLITKLLQVVYSLQKLVLSSMLLLLALKPKPPLSEPLSRAFACRPLQPPSLPPNPNPLDLGHPCPTPPTLPLTLRASAAQSRKPYLLALTSTLFPPMLSPLPQWLLLLSCSLSSLLLRGGRVPLLLRQ
jgi:hypothetical protein